MRRAKTNSAALHSWALVSLAALGCGERDGQTPVKPDGGVSQADAMTPDSAAPDANVAHDGGARDAGVIRPDAAVNRPPTGRIDTPQSDVTIAQGDTVSFSATCTDPEGRFVTHAWDFGDAAPSSSLEDPGPVLFDLPGTHTVTYRCRDIEGLEQAAPSLVLVTVPGPRWHPITGSLSGPNRSQLALVDLTNPGTLVVPGGVAWGAAANISSPPWMSPNRRYVAFAADLARDEAYDLHVVDLAAAVPTAVRVTNLPIGSRIPMHLWSPDSQKIAFSAVTSTATRWAHELHVVDLSGGLDNNTVVEAISGPPDLFRTWQWPQYPEANRFGAWSSDSSKLYFVVFTPLRQWEAWMFDTRIPAMGSIRMHDPLMEDAIGAHAVWAAGPDKALLASAVVPGSGSDLYVVDTGSRPLGPPVRLNPTPATNSRGASVSAFAESVSVSPNVDRVAFVSGTETGGPFGELYVARLDGTPGVERAHEPDTIRDVHFGTYLRRPNRGIQWSRNNRLLHRGWLSSGSKRLTFSDCGGTTCTIRAIQQPSTLNEGALSFRLTRQRGDAVVFVADMDGDGRNDMSYVDLTDGEPSAPLDITPRGLDVAECLGDIIIDSGGRAVFGCSPRPGAPTDLWVTDLTAGPGPTVKLNGTVTSTVDDSGFLPESAVLLPDGRILAHGLWRGATSSEAVLLDPANPGVHVPVHQPFGAGQSVARIPGHFHR